MIKSVNGSILTGTPSLSYSAGDIVSTNNVKADADVVAGDDIYATDNIWANDHMGVNGAVSATYELHVSGDAYATGSWLGSDVKFKKDITELEQASKIMDLRGVSYKWRMDEFPENGFDEGKQFGLIAQEVETVLPEIVNTDSKGFKSISYSKLTAVLVEAIKEQQRVIEAQQKTIDKFNLRFEQIETKLGM